MRLAYYAFGGGLGHLVRARAFLHGSGLGAGAVVLTASRFARDPRIAADLALRCAPESLESDAAAFRRWVLGEIVRLDADCLCIDTFPAGILGELCDLPAGLVREYWHVARLLHWPAYAALLRGATPRFARAWRVEALGAAQQQFIERTAARIEDLELIDPPAAPAPAAGPIEAPYWLIVHSGPPAEVAELIAYADEIRAAENAKVTLCVASAEAPADLPAATRVLDVYPATAYFAGAQRIFSAAGFNVMRQTAPFRSRQCVLPMPRRFDDQFERARRAFAPQRSSAPGAPSAA